MKSNILARLVGMALEILGPEPCAESRIPGFDARAASLDDERFRQACQVQFHRSLDGGPCAETDVLLVIGVESRILNVQFVRPRRERGEAQLAL